MLNQSTHPSNPPAHLSLPSAHTRKPVKKLAFETDMLREDLLIIRAFKPENESDLLFSALEFLPVLGWKCHTLLTHLAHAFGQVIGVEILGSVGGA